MQIWRALTPLMPGFHVVSSNMSFGKCTEAELCTYRGGANEL